MAKIIVIDDDPDVHSLLRTVLSPGGHEVTPALGGKEGVEVAMSGRADLIFLDLNMPEMNGIEVCQRLKAENATKDIPVVVMTALDDSSGLLESASQAVGAVEFIRKPFNLEELRDLVKISLERSRAGVRLKLEIVKGVVRLDPRFRRVWIRETLVGYLPPKRFQVLEILAQEDEPVEREGILKAVWGGEESPNTLEKTIQRLREDFGSRESRRIRTTPNGYELIG